MIYLIFSLLFSSSCEDLQSKLYNIENEFKEIKFCECMTDDSMDDFKSKVKKDIKEMSKCEDLKIRADSLWIEIKKQ